MLQSEVINRWGSFIHRVVTSLLLTSVMQAGVQALSLGAGLIVVRLLPVREYAYYTIATATLGTLAVLADCGIYQSVMAQAGKVWQSKRMLGGVIAGGIALRRRFGWAALAIALPMLFGLLKQQGAPSIVSLLITLSVVPAFLVSLAGQLYEVVPRVHQKLSPLQGIQLAGAGIRLLAVTMTGLLFPYASLACLAAVLGQAWTTWRMRLLAGTLASLEERPDPEISTKVIQQVRRMAPGAIYYAFSGQINVWLISIFGEAEAVAQVGALGRLAMAFNIVASVFSLVCVPRFSRFSADRRDLVLRRFWYTQVGLMSLLALIVGAVAWVPESILLVLGPDYGLLANELVLSIAGGALSLLAGSAYLMAAARGIVIPPWFVVPFALVTQVLLIVSLPISTVTGVLWLGVLANLTYWAVYVFYFTLKTVRGNESDARQK